jgi:Mg2+ and Co2+ transporter CorA
MDILGIFHMFRNEAEGISRWARSEHLLQTELDRWRRTLADLRKDTHNIVRNVNRFVDAICTSGASSGIRAIALDIEHQGTKIVDILENCQADLRADIDLLESRRGIAQAEGVNRLTELAFIYIPLTFVSSLFSMQIHELERGVPLSTFIYACIVATTTSYSLRLLIRSRSFANARRKVGSNIREYFDRVRWRQ